GYSRRAGHLPDPRLEFGERLWRDAPLAPVIRDAEPQEFTLLRSRHRTLRLVDLQPQLIGQKPTHRGSGAVRYRRPSASIRPLLRKTAIPEFQWPPRGFFPRPAASSSASI